MAYAIWQYWLATEDEPFLRHSELALRFFRDTSEIDLADTHVAIDGGVHIAALGGVWMIAVLGFAGLQLLPDGLAIDPQLPAGWTTLTFQCQMARPLPSHSHRPGCEES
ncbi:MAG: hypothetical protein M3Z66_03295 [Chloroflexota bacterium]|nr:hypothetical protein [Chloroflexota bacterium]